MTSRMEPILFHTTDWNSIPTTEHTGQTGSAKWKTIQYSALRIRVVEYSRNYKADHWCQTGHILYCLDGEMTTELSDGRVYGLSSGMSYQVSDGLTRIVQVRHTEQRCLLLMVDF